MNYQEQIQEQIAAWLNEIEAEFRPLLLGLSNEARKEFMAEKLAPRLEAACNDPEFKEKYIHHRAEQDIKGWLEYREPQGKYYMIRKMFFPWMMPGRLTNGCMPLRATI